ncbi:MAG: flippase-like domain-containing protein [Deltaproteobacteria bacterium]|nr:flippase-like domain-containing protein [Deltaproteobacteria bacterium]
MKKTKSLTSALNWKFWAGLFFSILFLYLALRQVDLANIWAKISSAHFLFLCIATLSLLLQYLIRGWRWHIFLEPVQKTAFSSRFVSILIGFAANCVLPARLGEIIRANYLGNRERISGSAIFGTVVVERLFDGLTLLLVLLIALWTVPFSEEALSISGISFRSVGFSVFFAYVLVILFLVGFKYKADMFLSVLDKILFFFSSRLRIKLLNMIRNFGLGLVPAKNIRGWILAIFYSCLLWSVSLLQIQLVALSIGIEVPFTASFLILALASFGVMIPSAPGFIGTFHFWVQMGFVLYGISKEAALSAAILYHAIFFFPTLLLGLISFIFLQTPIRELSKGPPRIE